MQDLYLRQQEINNVCPGENPRVAVIGCGGIGYWVALFLTLAGVKELHLFDHDKIESHNLNRLPFTFDQVNQNKALATQERLNDLRPNHNIHAYPEKFDPFYLTEPPNVLVCAADNEEARNQTYEYAQSYGYATDNHVHWIKATASLDHLTVTSRKAQWNAGSDDEGYGTPMWVAPVALSAVGAVFAALRQDFTDISCVKKIKNVWE